MRDDLRLREVAATLISGMSGAASPTSTDGPRQPPVTERSEDAIRLASERLVTQCGSQVAHVLLRLLEQWPQRLGDIRK
jgi:hypothetical protein